MSHLSKDAHEAVHLQHVQRDGMYSSRQISVEVPLASFHGVEHQLVVKTHALQQHHRAKQAHVDMTIEVCVQCGLTLGVVCHHGMSYWTHREGCPNFDPRVFDDNLPEGLYQHYKDAIGHRPDPNCTGCLLVCPVCKNDGT